ncbi:hypothetical protein VOLCADRAFT_55632 [Volvox carteri f. nagariensis]|uniref:Phosphatidate cytidylyltransferase n=1 Tax=Volvox carteri f. nagariensis TaxID=3068 RepID=D8THZ7_VOLCA|nr:uncharacterized protein VOLCADRAFT_55632 [Volvox carteri f. nagariensis]EFJ53153.1 hypothetical protein VOLCADRAFT_55632 [Volvox carteri f. nagariensis]|eukprot:XP_002946158.1 hypothetical protein VOLCADRAFT_55632 [Volvox carteri f. nagariensis]
MSLFRGISSADWLAFVQTALVAAVVMTLGLLAGRTGAFDKAATRKVLHIGMGGTYVLYWPLYSNAPYSRYLCATVPYAATLVFALVGLGVIPFEPLVRATARGGTRQELLTGPLLYGIIHVLATVVFWTSSPSGLAALTILCFGDGAAELAGRRWGRRTLWHNPRKTWIGSAACFLAGAICATAYTCMYGSLGLYDRSVAVTELAAGCTLSALVATLAESLPVEGDNLLMSLAAVVTAVWFFGF